MACWIPIKSEKLANRFFEKLAKQWSLPQLFLKTDNKKWTNNILFRTGETACDTILVQISQFLTYLRAHSIYSRDDKSSDTLKYCPTRKKKFSFFFSLRYAKNPVGRISVKNNLNVSVKKKNWLTAFKFRSMARHWNSLSRSVNCRLVVFPNAIFHTFQWGSGQCKIGQYRSQPATPSNNRHLPAQCKQRYQSTCAWPWTTTRYSWYKYRRQATTMTRNTAATIWQCGNTATTTGTAITEVCISVTTARAERLNFSKLKAINFIH